MTKRYLGNIITQNPTAPAGNFEDSAAKGVWSLEEQLAYQKAGLWPVPGNFPVDVEDVFSTYLYTGTGANQTITNGINLDGEGGLVWGKNRTSGITSGHYLTDTERGVDSVLYTERSDAAITYDPNLSSFNSNGFTLNNNNLNINGRQYASWTFRKAPKFFTCLTYTGTGAAQNISHNLGSVPGCIITKRTDASENWLTYHRGLDATAPEDKYVMLNKTNAVQDASTIWNDTAPTSTEFTVGSGNTNTSGGTYVAYLFAHNDGDGGFGADGDLDAIKCGSLAHAYSGTEVNLGFEPQWILLKAADQANNWYIFDAMRGIVTGGISGDGDAALFPNTSGAENVNTWGVDLTATGFIVYGNNIASSGNIIYMAIRRGTKVPESATEVFAIDTYGGTSPNPPTFNSGFPVDMAFYKDANGLDGWQNQARLIQGKNLVLNTTGAEVNSSVANFDYMDGYFDDTYVASSVYGWMWKRAPGYFDVVAYTGNGTAGRTVSHNLGVAPEMMWVKQRPYSSTWRVYHSALGNVKALTLNDTSAAYNLTSAWNSTTPTATEFTLGSSNDVNENPLGHIAYLFSSLDGISKVGSVSHTSGSATNVDCGFTSGARFILLKVTDSSGNWFLYDTTRGIVAGADSRLKLNSTAAENTSDDIDPLSSGFTITSTVSTGNYIFYAIA